MLEWKESDTFLNLNRNSALITNVKQWSALPRELSLSDPHCACVSLKEGFAALHPMGTLVSFS